MSYTACNVFDLGEAYTGVTLNAQLYSSSNSTVGSAITTGFYERAGSKGIYAFTLTVPDAHQGWCDVYVNGASSVILATLPINPAELENADMKTSTRSTFAGGAVASVTGNVGGNVVGSIGSLATQAKADVNAEADTALADAGVTTTVTGRIDAAITTRLATSGYTAPDNATITAIAGYVDTEVAAIKAKTDNLPSSPASSGNVTSAQTAIISAISALNNLSQAQAQSAAAAALTAYEAATSGNVSSAQTAITTAISALNNLSATDAAAAIMAYAMMDARQFQDVVMDLWAVLVGNASANDATNPTSISYQNVVTGGQVTHILDETTRTLD